MPKSSLPIYITTHWYILCLYWKTYTYTNFTIDHKFPEFTVKHPEDCTHREIFQFWIKTIFLISVWKKILPLCFAVQILYIAATVFLSCVFPYKFFNGCFLILLCRTWNISIFVLHSFRSRDSDKIEQ